MDEKHRIVSVARFENMTETDIADAVRETWVYRPKVFMEKVGFMPGDLRGGRAKNFGTFMRSYGFVRGCVISNRLELEDVLPQKWQQKLSLGAKAADYNARKRRHKERAQQLFPSTVFRITLDIADAILLAEYGYRTLNE